MKIFLGAGLPRDWLEIFTDRMLEDVRGIFDSTTNLMLVDVVEAAQRSILNQPLNRRESVYTAKSWQAW